MTTTTFAEKLLAKAQQLEEDAAALRRAAQVMNGHGLALKQGALPATIAAAAKLRKQQSPANGNGHGELPPPTRANRQAAILALLADGPRPAAEIHYELQAQGYMFGRQRLAQVLKAMPGVRVIGKSTNSRWQLKAAKPALDEPRSQPDTPEALSDHAATQQRRAEKANVIIEILRAAGKPLHIRDLSAIAREQGIAKLTGIAGLVRKGVLASRGQGAKRTYRLAT